MVNKFIFERYLSETPIFFQKFIMNQYVIINKKKKHDIIKYSDSIEAFKKYKCIFVHIPKTFYITKVSNYSIIIIWKACPIPM